MHKIKTFLHRNKEILSIPAGLIFWIIFSHLGKIFSWHTYPAGIFQKLIFGFIALMIINGIVWMIMKWNFPFLRDYLDSDNNDKWAYINEKDKHKFAFWKFALYFLSYVVIVALV